VAVGLDAGRVEKRAQGIALASDVPECAAVVRREKIIFRELLAFPVIDAKNLEKN
jgi:hypothetical protein